MDCIQPGSSVHGILWARITGVGCQVLLQGIFLTQGSNPHFLCLLHWQSGSLPLAPSRKPIHINVYIYIYIYFFFFFLLRVHILMCSYDTYSQGKQGLTDLRVHFRTVCLFPNRTESIRFLRNYEMDRRMFHFNLIHASWLQRGETIPTVNSHAGDTWASLVTCRQVYGNFCAT